MAFPVPKTVRWLLLNLEVPAVLILGVGILGGFAAERAFGLGLFERFGALTAGLAVLVFGLVSSELLNKAQDAYFARGKDDLRDPFGVSNIRRCLGLQSVVVLLGTLQWGFGALVFGNPA